MSQRRRKRKNSEIEDLFVEPSQGGFTQTQASQSGLSEDEERQLVANTVKFILTSDYNKHPIGRQNIVKTVNIPGRSQKSILALAIKSLREVFGYDLVQIDNTKFVLCNALENKLPHLTFPTDTEKNYTILFLALTYIFMSGGVVNEEAMWNFFRNLNLIKDNRGVHDDFGDIRDLIMNEFTKQKYIEKSKSENNNETTEFELQWGSRAHAELSYRSVLEFVSEMYKGRELESWPQQYMAVKKQERSAN